MHIYSVLNVDNLKLYEPSMLDEEEEHVLPSVEDLALDAQAQLIEIQFFKRAPELQDRGNMVIGILD